MIDINEKPGLMLFKRFITLNSLQKLKKDKLHFSCQKNDMLDTESNFARIWSSAI